MEGFLIFRCPRERRLLSLLSVSRQAGKQMHKSIDPAAVPGSLNLIDALELIVDRFNQSSLPQEDPVDNEEPGFYVIAEFGS